MNLIPARLWTKDESLLKTTYYEGPMRDSLYHADKFYVDVESVVIDLNEEYSSSIRTNHDFYVSLVDIELLTYEYMIVGNNDYDARIISAIVTTNTNDYKWYRPSATLEDTDKTLGELVEEIRTEEPEPMWSDIRNISLRFTEDYLIPQINNRYAMLTRPTSGLSNVVMDSFLPKIMVSSNLNERNIKELGKTLPRTACAISPLTAEMLGIKQITTEQLCRILGYSVRDISNIMKRVKALNYNAIFIGYGGTGVNAIHWLTEMVKMTHTVNLFKSVHIYEPDRIEVSNILRFPKGTETYGKDAGSVGYKLDMLSNEEQNLLTTSFVRVDRRYTPHTVSYRTFVYGAPGIDTRTSLSRYGNFISGTHADVSCSLHLNPMQDTDIQVESYGMIQLAPFFMNQLRMTIGLLEFLATNPDLTEQDRDVLDFAFDGESKMTTDRKYQFQIDKETVIQTIEEAIVDF